MGRIIEVDEFIAELWQVHLKVKEEGYVQVFYPRAVWYHCLTCFEESLSRPI
jgi:hypothetical protein